MAEEKAPSRAEMNIEGHWREDGSWQAPDGWPEGAGWVVKDPDGTIARWGPVSDLMLVATTDEDAPLPPPESLGAAFMGIPVSTPVPGATPRPDGGTHG